MSNLEREIAYLKGVGEKRARAFNKLGVFTVSDLLAFYPRRYEDRTKFVPIADAPLDEFVCIRAMVSSRPTLSRVRRGLELVKLRAVDDSGAVDITFFNQAYVRDNLLPGETYIFYGKTGGNLTKKTMMNPDFEKEARAGVTTGCIMPVYALSSGVSHKIMLICVRNALVLAGGEISEIFPKQVLKDFSLAQANFSIENIHFPRDYACLELARTRLIFEEFFTLACAMGTLRESRQKKGGLVFSEYNLDTFYESLPFSPTNAQKNAIDQCLKDMSGGEAMNRLVQGDVGSGKTLVAAACVYACCKSGKQAAVMAPTDILANQHANTLRSFLEPLGITVELLTSSLSAKDKRAVKERLKSGETGLVVGTHAIISGDVEFNRLCLVVADEQHRFGVDQRSGLSAKGEGAHILVMSATPIPRTLALMIYGELDVSVIDELPPGRQKTDTFCVDESYRPRLHGFIEKQVAEGRQVFIVCPMVEENEELGENIKSATLHAEDLARQFPKLSVACIHGRLKPKEKDAIMARVVAGEVDILVSTTVIEVGVDVPNASLMIVENAERFGLSQLHQLRGRVGRGAHKSYCVLVSDTKTEASRLRMKAMCETSDGFKISEADLALRGPGDFFGSRQHGLPEMRIADLCADVTLLKSAQEAAMALLARDPGLRSPDCRALRARIDKLFERNSDSFN